MPPWPRPIRPALRLLIVLVVALFASPRPTPVHAVPLNVRARAVVELDHRKTRDGLELEGRLLDDERRPIPDERLSLTLGEREAESLMTDADGRFRLSLDRRSTAVLERAHPSAVPWQARFPGSRRFSDVVASGAIDISRRASRLTLSLKDAPEKPRQQTRRLLPSEGARTLLARLEEAPGSAPLPDAEIRLRIGDGAELVGRTGQNGQVAFLVAPDQLEAGALYRATARFAGDALHVPALAELELQVQRPTRITLRVVREGDARSGRYRFSGRLSDQDGAIGNAVVVIEGRQPSSEGTPEREVAVERLVATDAQGLFVTAIDAAELDERRLTRLMLAASFMPSSPALAPSRSRPVLLEVPPPKGIPAGWYLIALTLLFAIASLAHAHRTGALARAFANLLDRLRALTTKDKALPQPTTPPLVTHTNPAAASRGRGDWLSGRVIDGHEGTLLVATLRVRDIAGEHELQTGPDGLFALGPLAPGPCHLELGADGFVSRELHFEVPHAGLYDGATWSLVAVKRKLRDIFGETVGGLGGELNWGVDTPREALTRALSRQSDRARVERPLAELTMLVERAHFARSAAEPSAVEEARKLQREVGSRPPDAGSS